MRHGFGILVTCALGALLVGCGEPDVITRTETVTLPDESTPEDVAKTPAADETVDAPEEADVWADHRGDVPWIIGSEKGLAQAREDGKPILFFYTATW